MSSRLIILMAFILCSTVSSAKQYKLWYRFPAREWEEALPVGNGRLGGMVFGGIDRERITLNEESIWGNGVAKAEASSAYRYLLEEKRRLIFEGKYKKAEDLKLTDIKIPADAKIIKEYVDGTNTKGAIYKPLADLYLHFGSTTELPTDYRRELDLEQALSVVTYQIGEVKYTREVFVSYPDQVIAIRINADKPGAVSFSSKMSHRVDVKDDMYRYDAELGAKVNSIKRPPEPEIEVKAPGLFSYSSQADPDGTKYTAYFKLIADGGTISTIPAGFKVDGANSATIYVTVATDFNYKEYNKAAFDQMQQVLLKSYEKIKADHITDYQKLYKRMDIRLEEGRISHEPTDKRVLAYQLGVVDPRVSNSTPRDNDLYALYFQYGRYLMIASARQGTLPPALQGIWNDSLLPPWYGNHTSDINVQMNYWCAESTNLKECHRSLLDFVETFVPAGKRVADISYGARGMVFHGMTFKGLKSSTSDWQDFAGWLAQDFWDHYEYSNDTNYLKNYAYPFIKECALFYLDFLTEDPRSGYLVSGPTYSPENKFYLPDVNRTNEYDEFGRLIANRGTGQLTMMPTMSRAIIYEVLTEAINASSVLDVDAAFRKECKDKRARLLPYQIGRYGQLQEWPEDFDEPNPGHRHMSHLYPLFPGRELTRTKNVEFTEAARKSLMRRFDNDGGWTGWSRAWMLCLAARLGDANFAENQLELMLAKTTLHNLFDTHPRQGGNTLCFQIEGNFGAVAGITEMLLQSHDGYLDILPAKPPKWKNGYINGLRARGNMEVDLEWFDGNLKTVTIRSYDGGEKTIKYGDKKLTYKFDKGESVTFNSNLAKL